MGRGGGDGLRVTALPTDLRFRRALPRRRGDVRPRHAEPPGGGAVGQAFVDSLRSRVAGRSLGVYPVNYPADEIFPPSASAGAGDAHAHVRSTVANCPNTKLVLGGYSQGALVVDLVTIAQAPIAGWIPQILTADEAGYVAALALFGNPSSRFLGVRNARSGGHFRGRPSWRPADRTIEVQVAARREPKWHQGRLVTATQVIGVFRRSCSERQSLSRNRR
ncbi:cutinase family protein [Mycobacterium arosiense]|uniref:cutinase family protein n=1 Tax=Mycobacterium arosiense TaxID=425468 RepID=UPI0026A9ED54